MQVETLGDAFTHSWRITVRCAYGTHDGMRSVRACIYQAELDLTTLVWTCGRNFPLARLESRMMCPRCGSRRVAIVFHIPFRRNRSGCARPGRNAQCRRPLSRLLLGVSAVSVIDRVLPRIPRYTGRSEEARRELDHFGNCPWCGALVDMRDLWQV